MARTKKERTIAHEANCLFFKPSDSTKKKNREIEIFMDELEAINLADVQGLTMKTAAEKMNISAPTFSRILTSARQKLGTAITQGHSIKICPCKK